MSSVGDKTLSNGVNEAKGKPQRRTSDVGRLFDGVTSDESVDWTEVASMIAVLSFSFYPSFISSFSFFYVYLRKLNPGKTVNSIFYLLVARYLFSAEFRFWSEQPYLVSKGTRLIINEAACIAT